MSALPMLLLPFCLLAAAFNDARRMLIPNELSIILLVGFGISALWVQFPMPMLIDAAVTTTVVFGVGFGMWALGQVIGKRLIGAGDVKLLAAVAPWLGSIAFVKAFFFITVFGALLGIALMIVPSLLRMFPRIVATSTLLTTIAERDGASMKTYYPYGIAIMAGTLCAFPSSPMFKALAGLPY